MKRTQVATIVAMVWVVLAAPWSFAAAQGANADARGAVLAAWMIATSLGVASAVQFHRGDNPRRAGLFLLASGLVMPTFAAVWLNLVPIAYGGLVALRSHRPRPVPIA